MKDLSQYFGMPIMLDEETGKLVSSDPDVSWEASSRKFSDKMIGLIADPSYDKKDEMYYDFYKAIVRNSDKEVFTSRELRYDSTVIFAGTANGEFKKTAGHFHMPIPGKTCSYPELYSVINGTAVFVMQKVDNYETTDTMTVEDLVLAVVHPGETIVIPPNYGHCTVNISDETLVFINLVAEDSHNYYDGVKASVGMSAYVFKDGDSFTVRKNPNYKFNCEPRITAPTDCPELGIVAGKTAYDAYLENPDLFLYLKDPEEKAPYCLSMLKDI